jgi:hypothetical protein
MMYKRSPSTRMKDAPPTPADRVMSLKHAKDSLKFNLRHAKEHMKAAKGAKSRLAQVRAMRFKAV